MSCNGCTKSYGFFTKEAGCPNCGFSFCTKCLKRTAQVPRLNNKPHKVCLNCYDRLNKAKELQPDPQHPVTPPNQPAITPDELLSVDPVEAATEILQPQQADSLIRERLQQLKQDRLAADGQSAPTDRDIAIRIANLKGQAYSAGTDGRGDPAILLATDRRTDEEKMRDLLQQFGAEVQLDEAADPLREIERRLAALRGHEDGGEEASRAQAAAEASTPDEGEQVRQLVARYIAEAALPAAANGDERELELTAEERAFVEAVRPQALKETAAAAEAAKGGGGAAAQAGGDAELPWCVICNEDAELRYQGDLFCRGCYREVRDEDVG